MEQQTWVTLLGFAGFALTLFTYLGSMKRELKGDMVSLKRELKGDMGDLKRELKGDMISLENRLGTRIDKVETQLGTRIDQARQEARDDNLATRAELGARISDLRQDVADVRADQRAISQRLLDVALPRHPAATSTEGT